MIVFQREKLSECWDESWPLFVSHWEETEQYRHQQKLNPDKDRLFAYERMGIYYYYTARDENKLIGHCGMYVMLSVHTQELIATEDTWFLLPENRKSGTGIRLHNFVKDEMKNKNVTEIMMTAKLSNKAGQIMEKLGYQHIANQYSLHL